MMKKTRLRRRFRRNQSCRILLDFVYPKGLATDELKNLWKESVEDLRKFVRDLRQKIAPREFENPWGDNLALRPGIFGWIDGWTSKQGASVG
jgi:hypothetical protein